MDLVPDTKMFRTAYASENCRVVDGPSIRTGEAFFFS